MSAGLVRQTTERFVPSQELSPEVGYPDQTVATMLPRLRKTNAFSQESAKPQVRGDLTVRKPEMMVMAREKTQSKTKTSKVTDDPEERRSQATNDFDQRAARGKLSIPLSVSATTSTARLSVTPETFELRRLSLETDSFELRRLSSETNSSELRKISLATDDSELRKISFPTDSSDLRKLSEATDDSELRKLSLLTDSSEASTGLAGGTCLMTTASSEKTFHLVSPLVDEPDDDTVSERNKVDKFTIHMSIRHWYVL